MIPRHCIRIVGLLAAALALTLPAKADQRYVISGDDRYQIGAEDLKTSIRYAGTQELRVRRADGETRFTAQARYTRTDSTGKMPGRASFEQVMTSQGNLRDGTDLDPDYLTVLNQPFAIELDDQTLNDLVRLRGRLPFDFPAPMTGGTLHGYIQRGGAGRVDSKPALAVDFDASGPMVGPLPDQTAMSIAGKIRMRGTAYYALRGEPLLLALRETLTIEGTLRDHAQSSPVRIQYRRSIKADDSAPAMTEASSH